MSPVPERTLPHEVAICEHGQARLVDIKPIGYEERQVFDIPAIQIEVTAHRAAITICPTGGAQTKGTSPVGVTPAGQDGPEVKTWAAYCSNQHHLPVERTAPICDDLVHQPIGDATVLKASEALCESIAPSSEAVQKMRRDAAVVPLDESGLRVRGKLYGLPVASTERLTSYEVHAKRGHEAMDAAGIWGACTGIAVHDHWKPYFHYDACGHALCNAHHLREWHVIATQYQQVWATDLSARLLEIKAAVAAMPASAMRLAPAQLAAFARRDAEVVQAGCAVHPPPPPAPEGTPNKRGRSPQPPPVNLRRRLRDFQTSVLRFMSDFRVPFDNNQGKRDIRMVKVKQKVSGGFRTLEGAQSFGRIRGYISTARQHSKNVFAAIREAFDGHPFIPSPHPQ